MFIYPITNHKLFLTYCRLSLAVPNVFLSCTIGQICVVYGINMVTHTRKSCSAFTHPSTQTHSSEHTHTVNTHPEQWAVIYAAAPGEQLGFRCLAQGHLAVVLKVERALYIHSPPTIPAGPRLELATFRL